MRGLVAILGGAALLAAAAPAGDVAGQPRNPAAAQARRVAAHPPQAPRRVRAARPDCSALGVDPLASQLLSPATPLSSGACRTAMSHGYTLPDPRCTPGSVNPTLTLVVLRNPRFRTGCVRDTLSSDAVKQSTYPAYSATKPRPNSGAAMVCELDHLVSLELGGSDAVENIWPQCGPAEVPRDRRFFHRKDIVENYLAAQVEAGTIDLGAAQRGISRDWTQYIVDAERWQARHPAKRQADR